MRLLTDPLLRGRLAHLTRRVAGRRPDVAGRIDAVLISHVHRDHLDRPTLRPLARVPIIAPRGARASLRGLGDVHELDAGESTRRRRRAGHAPRRAVHAVRRAAGARIPALGYVVDEDLYFAGDTDRFARWPRSPRSSSRCCPCGGTGRRSAPGTWTPSARRRRSPLLRPRLAVPIHWGTYFPLPLGLSGPPPAARAAADLRGPGGGPCAGHRRARARARRPRGAARVLRNVREPVVRARRPRGDRASRQRCRGRGCPRR